MWSRLRSAGLGFNSCEEGASLKERGPSRQPVVTWFCCCCSVTKLCPTLCNPMDCSTPGFPVLHHLPGFVQTVTTESVMPSNHLILCCPLFLMPSIFPSIRVFFNKSVLHIRCPKYWSFSFNISSLNEYSGLISFRIIQYP